MITHTFINKCNTIYRNSQNNVGLNPVLELNYGQTLSRILLYFNINNLIKKYKEGDLGDLNDVKHILKLTNCGSNPYNFFPTTISNSCELKTRASSFNLIAFKIPMEWDEGNGFDRSDKYYNIVDGKNQTNNGSNWYQPSNNYLWENEGIYTTNQLSLELDKFILGEESIIISRQTFDFGNENIEMDLTEFVNDIILNETYNYGVGLSFSPFFENNTIITTQYVGFYSKHTNTFFQPYLETIYDNYIDDNRDSFYINKLNRLYLYSIINNNYENLDILPKCSIDDIEYEVKQSQKGVYYVDILCDSTNFSSNVIYYDIWSDLYFQNNKLDDVEMEFVVLNGNNNYFKIGNYTQNKESFNLNISGINDYEELTQNEVRNIYVDFRKAFTKNDKCKINKSEYKIYIKSADSNIIVYNYQPINHMFLNNIFTIDTSELIPERYYIDIRVYYNNEVKNFNECLIFDIKDKIK